MKRKTIGVIGLGSIGMRHAKNLASMGHFVLGYDPNINRKRWPVGIVPVKLSDMLGSISNRDADGIVIASPTNLHYQHIVSTHTIASVFVEKPIADDTYDFDHFRITMVGNNLRFHSCVKQAKEWLTEGRIGDVLWGSFCVAQHNIKYKDPCILNWGAHEVDLALYLLGSATVAAAVGRYQTMDVILCHSCCQSVIHCDYVAPVEQRVFSILGTKGNITVDLVERTAKLHPKKGMTQFLVGEDSFDENYKEEMQAFIDLIDDKPVPHAATGQDGLAALEVILEAQRKATT